MQLVTPLRSAYWAHHGYQGRAALGRGSPASPTISAARANRVILIVVSSQENCPDQVWARLSQDNAQYSVGNPAAFHALSPPARWARWGSPAAWAISAALSERMPDAQEKTTDRPAGSGSSAGSKVESGTSSAPGIRSIAVSLGSRTSIRKILPAFMPLATSSGVRSCTCPPPNRPYIACLHRVPRPPMEKVRYSHRESRRARNMQAPP